MLYKTPQNIDAKVLNFAKQELAERQQIDYWELFNSTLTIFSNIFLSNFKNAYFKIKNSKSISLEQLLNKTLATLFNMLIPASLSIAGQPQKLNKQKIK